MIKKIMVIGAGQMGAGIAQVCAQSGYEVILHDLKLEVAHAGIKKIESGLNRLLKKEMLTVDERQSILARVIPTDQLSASADVDMVIEAATENLKIKKQIFTALDDWIKPDVILATNTSSLSITEIASVLKQPQKMIGMHFMNPVPVMKLVELIRGIHTSEETFKQTIALTEAIKKTPIEVKDFPGFVLNRVLITMINEAIYTLYEGVATVSGIDEVMKLGANFPMGPLALADLIGLDTCLAIMETLHDGFGDSKYRPCPLLKQYVAAGLLGKKSGAGFYTYNTK